MVFQRMYVHMNVGLKTAFSTTLARRRDEQKRPTGCPSCVLPDDGLGEELAGILSGGRCVQQQRGCLPEIGDLTESYAPFSRTVIQPRSETERKYVALKPELQQLGSLIFVTYTFSK